MKKRIIIILIVLVTVLSTALLYQTFATDSSTLSESSDVYNISLYNGSTIVVPANGTKTVLYKINSPNFGKVSYGVGYTTSSSYIKVKEYYDTIDPVTGVIDYRENKFVKLKLINSGNSDASVTLNTVLGYEFGGNLIPSSNVTLVTEKVKEYDTLMSVTGGQTATSTFLRSRLKRNQIDSITFKENNAVPDNVTSVDVSKDSDGSIIMYYGTANSNGRYDVYIGSEAGKIKLESGYALFSYLQYVESLDLSIFNTSSVTNMVRMFYYAGQNATTFTLYGLDNWDTSSVTNMSSMFYYAGQNATTWMIGDLSSWDTSSVTSMDYMFSSAGKSATTFTLEGLNGWDTSSVTDMSYMFSSAGYNATTFTLEGLDNWNTSSVKDMSGMFSNVGYNATTFTLEGLDNWDTSSVKDMSVMFSYAGYKASNWSLDLSRWNTSSVTDMLYMFRHAGQNATTWTIGDLSNWNTSSVTNMSYMFQLAGQNATTFTLEGLSSWDTSSVTNMSCMFQYAGQNATTFTIGDLSGWDTSSVTDMGWMFQQAGYKASNWSLDLSSWNVNKVTSNSGFNASVTTKVTPPIW